MNGTGGRTGLDAIDWRVHEGNVEAAAEDLRRRGAGLGPGPVLAENDAAVMVEHAGQRARRVTQRNAGRGTPESMGRWRCRRGPGRRWRRRCTKRSPPGIRCRSGACMYRRPMETSSARHSRVNGPLPPGAGPARVGTRMGGPFRTQIVWVPAGSAAPTRSPRCSPR